jgi:hypothetical protein
MKLEEFLVDCWKSETVEWREGGMEHTEEIEYKAV